MFSNGILGGKEDGSEPIAIPSDAISSSVAGADVGGLAPAARALAEEARTAGAPATAVNGLVATAEQLDQQSQGLQALQDDPAQAGAAIARADEMKRIATSANIEFANALLRDADARAARSGQRTMPAGLTGALASLRSAVQASATATDPGQSLSAARDALAKSQLFTLSLVAANKRAADALVQVPKKIVVIATPSATEPVAAPPTTGFATASSATGVSPAKMAQFNAIISEARSSAKQVIAMANQGSGDAGSQTRKANAALARNYDKYLANLKDSMRGAKSDRDADRLIKQANQTKAYISFLMKQSSQAPR